MSDATNEALSRAYDLIEQGQLDEARSVLEPILAGDRNNLDAWWLYAHAVTNPEDAREALENVTRLDPNYGDAPELLSKLNERYPVGGIYEPSAEPEVAILGSTSTAPEPQIQPASGVLTPQPTAEEPHRSSGMTWVLVTAVIVVLLIAALLLLQQQGGQPATTPIADAPTAETLAEEPTPLPQEEGSDAGLVEVTDEPEFAEQPTEEAEQVIAPAEESTPEMEAAATELSEPTQAESQLAPTDEAPVEPTAESAPVTESGALVATIAVTPLAVDSAQMASEIDFSVFDSALASFDRPQDSIAIDDTSLGRTLLVSICAEPGPELRDRLPAALLALAGESDAVAGSADAIGIRTVNCGDGSLVRVVAVGLESALSFADGTLDAAGFVANWRAQ